MDVHIDVSATDAPVALGLAQDGPGDRYLLLLNGVELVINHAQMESLYGQMRGWFEEE